LYFEWENFEENETFYAVLGNFADEKKLTALNENLDVQVLQPIVKNSERVLNQLAIFGKGVKMMHVHLYRREEDSANHTILESYFVWKFFWFFVEERSSDGEYQNIGFIPLESFTHFFNEYSQWHYKKFDNTAENNKA